jgi:hypothetical protein
MKARLHSVNLHTSFSPNAFSPQIVSAVDHQSNKKSTTILVAENQHYQTMLVELMSSGPFRMRLTPLATVS